MSCEECHGPGSVHVELASSWSPFWDRNIGYGLPELKSKDTNVQIETCAKCHSRRYQVHEDFRPGQPLLDYYEPFLLADTLYHSRRPDSRRGVRIRLVPAKQDARQPRALHRLPRSPFAQAEVHRQPACARSATSPAKYDTPAHHHHKPDSAGAQCIECHMPSRLYMVIDERRDHSFRVPRPDLSVELGTPNACNNCHVAESLRDSDSRLGETRPRGDNPSLGETRPREAFQWAADAIVKWYGPKRAAEPGWAPAIAAGRAGKPEGEQLLLDVVEHNATPAERGRVSFATGDSDLPATSPVAKETRPPRVNATPAIVRATAIDLLANYPSNRSVAARRKALQDSDPLVRFTAVRGLSGDTPSLLVSDLAGVLDDPTRFVRVAAAARLAYLPLDQLTDAQRTSFERAMIEFRKSQELTLDHAGGHLVLGALDRQHGRSAQALEHLRAAIKLEPYMVGPRAELASLMQQLRGNAAEIRRLREEEADLLERDARLAPDNAAIHYQLGMLRYLLGQLDEAQAALTTAVERAPQNYEILMALALLHEERHRLSGDEEQFKAAVEALKKLNDMQPEDQRAQDIFSA